MAEKKKINNFIKLLFFLINYLKNTISNFLNRFLPYLMETAFRKIVKIVKTDKTKAKKKVVSEQDIKEI